VWGLDLSGAQAGPATMQGAGGVGGLLWMTQHTGPDAGMHFAAYDGNGNIVALSAASDGSESARYEYGPFGEPIRVTGPMAKENPFRFSTKRTDKTTDSVLYEYRVYSPAMGRWLSRDPVGEKSFRALGSQKRVRAAGNLYVFVANDPDNGIDRLGLDYYIIQVEGVCGVRHRKFIGDDGRGNSYEIDIVPDVEGTYDPRRICGIGKIQYFPRTGSATNWFIEMIKLEKHVRTTTTEDEALAANAKALDGRKIFYCLYVQDCRSIEKCTVTGKTFGQRAVDELLRIVNEAFDAVLGSADDP